MSDHISQRYIGMGAYDLQRYYDLLLIMRKHYQSDLKHDQANNPKGNHLIFLIIVIKFVVTCWLIVWSILQHEWLVFSLVLGLGFAMFAKAFLKDEHTNKFETGFIEKVIASGFSRADATEFLYDIDWDDIQYEESRVKAIMKDIEELKNVKNQ